MKTDWLARVSGPWVTYVRAAERVVDWKYVEEFFHFQGPFATLSPMSSVMRESLACMDKIRRQSRERGRNQFHSSGCQDAPHTNALVQRSGFSRVKSLEHNLLPMPSLTHGKVNHKSERRWTSKRGICYIFADSHEKPAAASRCN
jgi:hypothetical protein